ncbi:MAG TPA: hypothetical protein VMD28_01120 [Acidimicrobiales bacterium]|nr:hypothetical protein [Acidimicrobiales bacterium]
MREPPGVLVIDAANVIGSRPTGWWRDRAGAARQFVEQLGVAAREGKIPLPAVVVLEGDARGGAVEADVNGLRVVHAAGDGDDAVVAQISGKDDIVVTSDRGLRQRARQRGAETVGPGWLYERLRAPRSGANAETR